MLDLKTIRENPDMVRSAVASRNDTAPIDDILKLDVDRRKVLSESENLKAKRNEVSKQIAKMKEKPAALIAEMREVGDQIKAFDEKVGQIDQQLNDLLLQIPNIPHPDTPVGKGEDDNKVVWSWGEPRKPDFEVIAHWDLGPKLDIIDFDRGTKLSGSRFYVLKGLGALLQRALTSYMLDLHIKEHGYTEIYPPYLVKSDCLYGTGSLPKFGDNIYHDEEDDLWLVPTAEVPVTNLHRDEILQPGMLPLYYVSHTACFRREKMSAGRDTRGIKRVHQFEKVEMYKFVEPEKSEDELDRLVKNAETICQQLELPYRVLALCTADISFPANRSFDLEMWAPGSNEWLEVSSCSNCGDFQARRANIRYRPEAGAKPQYVHTLNGSGLALPRVIIAIMENYQQEDGSIVVPDVLRPYMGGLELIK
ncbi:MAG: serine--tRNA ligase [Chloroflexi bacterium]|jgi:seryl-tRNA synthetase|nr:serine--tRNA ligase [Chloroflexota bacterium]MBT7080916.1 serine--tRNA ligase [Chloroflexota bacterium]MBT7289063.1 serine--tRNA ligase [Chloroflexota bacterium]